MPSSSPPASAAALAPTTAGRPSPRWLVLLSAFGAALVTAACFAPRFWLWPLAGAPLGDIASIQPEFHRAFFALQQLQNPWQHIDSEVNRVMEWRLLWPVLGHYGAVPDAVYFALPHLGCLLALGTTAAFAWRAVRDTGLTVATTLLVATSSWFFVSTGWLAYFDSWLVLALLLASFSAHRWVLFGTALLTPWIDERFILALPLCLGLRVLVTGDASDRTERWREAGWLVAGLAPYLLVRLGAEALHVRTTSTSYWAQRSLLPAPLDGMMLGVWHGLRLGWIAVAAALLVAVRGRHWTALAAVAVSLALNLCVADDISRSASVAVPLLLAGVIFAAQLSAPRARIVVAVLATANLALPAAHIIATPLSPTERYHTLPIHGLVGELRAAHLPPAFADPGFYTDRGLQALGAGELAIARRQFEVALRLEPDHARALANHGITRFAAGDKPAGLAELDRALARDPALFDVRLQRAAFRQQVGRRAEALADVREALRQMPADWPRRRAAEQFERALAAEAAGRP